MSSQNANPPITPQRFRELCDMVSEMMAGEEAYKLWQRIYAQRRAIREVSKSV